MMSTLSILRRRFCRLPLDSAGVRVRCTVVSCSSAAISTPATFARSEFDLKSSVRCIAPTVWLALSPWIDGRLQG